MSWLLWIANILIDTTGQLAFKRAATARERRQHLVWSAFGVTCYVIEFGVWLAFLSLLPLSRGVLLGSINIVVVAIAGRLLFGETLSARRTLGIALIAGGVSIVGLT